MAFAGFLPQLQFDLDRLRTETLKLRQMHGLENLSQISLRHRPDTRDPWREGAGSLWSPENRRAQFNERDFTQLNAALHGSYLEECLNQMCTTTGFRMGRARVLTLAPRQCYSFHKDSELRFHVPLVTSDQSVFLFTDRAPIHLPADGRVYWVDTRRGHSAMNGHADAERIHLVVSMMETELVSFASLTGEDRGQTEAAGL